MCLLALFCVTLEPCDVMAFNTLKLQLPSPSVRLPNMLAPCWKTLRQVPISVYRQVACIPEHAAACLKIVQDTLLDILHWWEHYVSTNDCRCTKDTHCGI